MGSLMMQFLEEDSPVIMCTAFDVARHPIMHFMIPFLICPLCMQARCLTAPKG